MQKCFSLALPIEDNDNDKDGDDEEEEGVHLQSVVKQLVILEPHVKRRRCRKVQLLEKV